MNECKFRKSGPPGDLGDGRLDGEEQTALAIEEGAKLVVASALF